MTISKTHVLSAKSHVYIVIYSTNIRWQHKIFIITSLYDKCAVNLYTVAKLTVFIMKNNVPFIYFSMHVNFKTMSNYILLFKSFWMHKKHGPGGYKIVKGYKIISGKKK